MISLNQIPNGYKELIAMYGDPDSNHDGKRDPAWEKAYLKIFNFAVPMRIAWGSHYFISRFRAHRLVGDAIVDALAEVFEQVGVEEMRLRTWDYWAGCDCFRHNVNSPSKLSVHSWAAACDINPHLAPNGVAECHQPLPILAAFKRRGFIWAARDWMHVQACINY